MPKRIIAASQAQRLTRERVSLPNRLWDTVFPAQPKGHSDRLVETNPMADGNEHRLGVCLCAHRTAEHHSVYTRDPRGALVGVAPVGGESGAGRLVYTDLHSDVVAQFAASGAVLEGSAGYDPLGNVIAASGQIGALGFQSGWTDPASSEVNMAARWYNPATGQFMNKDSASADPAPHSGDANPFAYTGDNPLTRSDPSGHDWMSDLGGLWDDITSAASTVFGSVKLRV